MLSATGTFGVRLDSFEGTRFISMTTNKPLRVPLGLPPNEGRRLRPLQLAAGMKT